MRKKLCIGIVGCGAIGTSLAKIIVKDFAARARLAAIYDYDTQRSLALARRTTGNRRCVCSGLEGVIAASDLIIEAASASHSYGIASRCLSAGKNIIVMSIGGVVSRFHVLKRLAEKHNARLYIPSGAVCGIDALKAARIGRIRSVTLTTRKPPHSFRSVPYVAAKKIDLEAIRKDTVLFSGTAEQAMKYFPQNINVAGVLSLAGIGPRRTRVCIVASPRAKRNSHEIAVESTAGTIFTRTENVIHPDNPKTSYLAVLSAAGLIRQILEPARIGT
ncbi:MAG TPA: aspartate dehydrogenase [Candidatus Omnitrophota bacterium]|nr:aspartate dehydrogenase [Candidatus Omnitrophota bacterium]HQJ15784.1 aspartate dehydrogenase [Candidatus Omnitrophota bacterium]